MVWPHFRIIRHGEDNFTGDSEKSKKEKNTEKRWEDNIKEWIGIEFGDSLRASEDREMYKCIVATSFVVARRRTRLRNREMREKCDFGSFFFSTLKYDPGSKSNIEKSPYYSIFNGVKM